MWWLVACGAPDPQPVDPEPAPPEPVAPAPTPPAPTSSPCAVEVLSVAETAPHVRSNDRAIAVTLSEAAAAAVLCVADDEPDDRFLLESPAATDHTLALQGLRFGTTYTCAAGATCPGAGIAPFGLVVGVPPAFDPPIEVVSDGADRDGWLLAGMLTEGCLGPGALAVFDLEGRLRWHFPLAYTGLDFELSLLGDGVLLYGGHTGLPGPAAHHVWDGELWTADVPGDPFLHHDSKQIADGTILTLEERVNIRGGDVWTGFAVRAYDPVVGTFTELYDSQSAVDEGVLGPGSGDEWHANWIDVKDHGAGPKLYVSLCYTYQVLRIDLTTGTVDWVLGRDGNIDVVDAQGEPAEFSQCQHGLEVSDDGTRLLVYDNGRDRFESRVFEVALDEAQGIATVTWEWTDGWFEELLGDVDWLPTGSVLVTQSHPECFVEDGLTRVVEVDPVTGIAGWTLTFLDQWHVAYRTERIDGCALFSHVGECPALEARWSELAPRFGF